MQLGCRRRPEAGISVLKRTLLRASKVGRPTIAALYEWWRRGSNDKNEGVGKGDKLRRGARAGGRLRFSDEASGGGEKRESEGGSVRQTRQ